MNLTSDALSSVMSFLPDPTAVHMASSDLYFQHTKEIGQYLQSIQSPYGVREVLQGLSALTTKEGLVYGFYTYTPEEFADMAKYLPLVYDILPQIWGAETERRLIRIYFRSLRPQYSEVREHMWREMLRRFTANLSPTTFWAVIGEAFQDRYSRDGQHQRSDYAVVETLEMIFEDCGVTFSPEFTSNPEHVSLETFKSWPSEDFSGSDVVKIFRAWIANGLPYYNSETGVTLLDMQDLALIEDVHDLGFTLNVYMEFQESIVEFSRMIELYFQRQFDSRQIVLPVDASADDIPHLTNQYAEMADDVIETMWKFRQLGLHPEPSDTSDPSGVWAKMLIALIMSRHSTSRDIIDMLLVFWSMQNTERLGDMFMEMTVINNIPPLISTKNLRTTMDYMIVLLDESRCINWFVNDFAPIKRLIGNLLDGHVADLHFLGAILGAATRSLDNPNALSETVTELMEKAFFAHHIADGSNLPNTIELEGKMVGTNAMNALKYLLAFANRTNKVVTVTDRRGNDQTPVPFPMYLMEKWNSDWTARVMFAALHNEMAGQIARLDEQQQRTISETFIAAIVNNSRAVDFSARHFSFYFDGTPRVTDFVHTRAGLIEVDEYSPGYFAAKMLRHPGIQLRLKQQLLLPEAVADHEYDQQVFQQLRTLL